MSAGATDNDPRSHGAWSLFEMSYAEAAELLEQTKRAMIVIGSTEQHGPHLPLGTDAMGAIAVARRIRSKIPIVVAPPLLIGYSPYHMSWAGSITLRTETLLGLLLDVGTSLVRHGVREIVFLNGHGGNKALIDVAASDLQQVTSARVLVVNYPYLNESVFGKRMDLGHAGRFETAAVMAYDKKLVNLSRAVDPSEDKMLERQARYRGIAAYPMRANFRDTMPTGWGGRPHDATDQDAEDLAERMADRIIELIEGEFGPDRGASPVRSDAALSAR